MKPQPALRAVRFNIAPASRESVGLKSSPKFEGVASHFVGLNLFSDAEAEALRGRPRSPERVLHLPGHSPQEKRYVALYDEETISWMKEFSYIWSQHGFDLDDSRTSKDDPHNRENTALRSLTGISDEPTSFSTEERLSCDPFVTLEKPLLNVKDSDPSNDDNLNPAPMFPACSALTGLTRDPSPSESTSRCSACGTTFSQHRPRRYKRRRIKSLFTNNGEQPDPSCEHCHERKSQGDFCYDPSATLRPPGVPQSNPLSKPPSPTHIPSHLPPHRPPPTDSSPTKAVPARRPLPKPPPPEPPPHPNKSPLTSKLRIWSPLRDGNKKPNPHNKVSEASTPPLSTARSVASKAKGFLKTFTSKAQNRITKNDGRYAFSEAVLPAEVSFHHRASFDSQRESHCTTSLWSSVPSTEWSDQDCCSLECCSYDEFESSDCPALNIRIVPESAPQPFQCTFCLAPCGGKLDWMQHERCSHMLPHMQTSVTSDVCRTATSWAKHPSRDGPRDFQNQVSSNRATHTHSNVYSRLLRRRDRPAVETLEIQPKLDGKRDWLWNCGFCDTVLRSWSQRQEHIAEDHFEKGTVMTSWDPLRSPYPCWKMSLLPVPGFPHWDPSPLLALQRPGLLDILNRELAYRMGDTRKQHWCKTCKIPFVDLEASIKHTDLWHRSPDCWTCPTLSDRLTPNVYFDKIHNSPENGSAESPDGATGDFCLCCDEKFEESPPNWDERERHLREKHNIHKNAGSQKFFRKEQFSLHLANCHNVRMGSCLVGLTKRCRGEDRAPFLTVDLHGRQ